MHTLSFEPLHDRTPELARYGGEPAQMPSASHGKCGFLDLRFELEGQRDDGPDDRPDNGRQRTLLRHMERRVPFLVQKALYWDECLPDMPCVMIITTTGCVLQGDRLELRVQVDEGARAHVTTQSATKIHMMEANYAAQVQVLTVAEGAYLEYMPDPVIPHRTSRYAMDTRLTVAEGGAALYAEILQCGRLHHHEAERFGFDLYAAHVELFRPGGAEPIFAERLAVEPHLSPVEVPGVMHGFEVFGTALLAAPPEAVRAVREHISPVVTPQLMSGASVLPDECGLSFRVLGKTAESVKTEIRRFWAASRLACTGQPLPEEFLWR